MIEESERTGRLMEGWVDADRRMEKIPAAMGSKTTAGWVEMSLLS